jgi:VanZ family protein
MNRYRKNRIRQLWAPILLMGVISLFSGSPGVQLEGWSFTGIDKLGHLVIFGLLGIAWARFLRAEGGTEGHVMLLAIALTTVFGISDELHQYLNPLRTFEWADLAADFAGATVATGLYLKVSPVKSLLEIDIRDFGRLRSLNKIPLSLR